MSQLDLTIKPAQTEVVLKPNSIFTQAYDIINNSSESVLLSTSVSPWIPADNLGTVSYTDTTINPNFTFSLSNSDLKLNQDFLLSPKQKKQLVLKINNRNTQENDHYFTFFITQKPLNNLNSKQNLAKIGSHILVSTSTQNEQDTNLQITSTTVTPKIKDIFLPIRINGEIFNNGKHYSQITGHIVISKNNLVISDQNLFPYTVTPQNSRLLHCLNSQNENTPCQINSPIWPGFYQGTITLNNSSSKSEYSFNFFVFPYILIVTTIFIFLLLNFLLNHKQSISSRK